MSAAQFLACVSSALLSKRHSPYGVPYGVLGAPSSFLDRCCPTRSAPQIKKAGLVYTQNYHQSPPSPHTRRKSVRTLFHRSLTATQERWKGYKEEIEESIGSPDNKSV